jgi:hypothetical protein
MTSRVELLMVESENAIVFFREYVIKRGGYANPIFIIEGKDDPKFYSGIIGAYFGNEWDFISAGGKSNVLDVRAMIINHSKYKSDKVAFLVDRDFDDIEIEPDLYVTPTYAIENIYCQPSTFERVLVGECGLSDYKVTDRDQIKNRLTEEYEHFQRKFHKNRNLLLLNALYLYTKKVIPEQKIGADDIAKINVKIKDGKLIVTLDRKKRFASLTLQSKEIKTFLKDPKWIKIFKDPNTFLRGKQEFQFFREAISHLKDGGFFSTIAQKEFGVKIKLDNPSMADHALSTTSQYVAPPECLIDFMMKLRENFAATRKAD